MGLWGDHDGEVVLDYGCGPGDDTVGLLLYSGASQVIGVDISARALALARRRIALHAIDERRVHLIRIGDAGPVIPLDDSSVDVVHCSGVLHHTSDPGSILREFHRILKPQGRAQVMVYNRDSVWFDLYTAYVRMINEGVFAEISVEEAFARNTDGPECPISRRYRPAEFLALAHGAGFEGDFAGNNLSARSSPRSPFIARRRRQHAVGVEILGIFSPARGGREWLADVPRIPRRYRRDVPPQKP